MNSSNSTTSKGPNVDEELKALDEAIKDLPGLVDQKMKLHDTFRSIHKRMLKGAYYHDLLDYIFTSLQSVIPYDRMGIALLEDKGKSIRLSWVKSKMDIHFLQKEYLDSLKGSGLQKILSSKTPRIIPDLLEYFKENPQSKSVERALKDGIRSSLTCPIVAGGRILGVIFFASPTPGSYSQSHIGLFKEVAEELSLIIEHELMRKSIEETGMKEKLFRDTIHELNNPLGVIKGVLDVIGRKEWFNQLSEESRSVFKILSKKNETMIQLVRDLSQISALNGLMKINITKNKLHDFLTELLHNSEMLARAKNTKIELNVIGPLPKEARFDSIRIMQALENLIANAIKYSESSSKVTIDVIVDEDRTRLSFFVKDQGPGIPETEMGKLFKEYGKTSVRPTAGESSHGLGLAIVKQVVAAHKGEVAVQSKVGVGSVFSFWIPL